VEEAKDLTQSFFAALFDGGQRTFSPDRGRFRTFLKAALDNFLKNTRRDAMRLKRGGGATAVPLEIADDGVVKPTDDLFEREWRRSLFERALDELQRERPPAFECFRRYFLDPSKPTYREVADAVGLSEFDVTNHLHWARGRMREIVRRLVRESCESDDEFRDELSELFG
jgi:RNA polymerase sigma-70 factor (ECF subfamily)